MTFESQGVKVTVHTDSIPRIVPSGYNKISGDSNIIKPVIRCYTDYNEAINDIPHDVYFSEYVLNNWNLEYIQYKTYSNQSKSDISYAFRYPRPELKEEHGDKFENAYDNISFFYTYNTRDIQDPSTGFNLARGSLVKQIKVLGIDGFMGITEEERFSVKQTKFTIQMYSPSIEITEITIFRNYWGEISDEKRENLESELLQIVEEIVSQYQ